MPLTPAEKQRQYRERRRKNNPEKDKDTREKDRARYHKNKKLVPELTAREHRVKRKEWRKRNETRSIKKKSESARTALQPDSERIQPASSRGRKAVLRRKTKCVRENVALKEENSKLRKSVLRYKQKLQRNKSQREKTLKKTPDNQLTPRSKADKHLLQSGLKHIVGNRTHMIRRKLIMYNAVSERMVEIYQKSVGRTQKNVVGNIAINNALKVCRMTTEATSLLGLAQRRRKSLAALKINKRKLVKDKIVSFFNQDDVSRATAGKKETVTRDKNKCQKRFLVDTMKNLHSKFLKDKQIQVSYTTFTRCRPFYVLSPSECGRDTCLCKKHSNIDFMVEKLYELKYLKTRNSHKLVEELVCDKRNADCMYNLCKVCSNRKITILQSDTTVAANKEISWWRWELITMQKENVGDTAATTTKKVTQKVKKSGTVEELICTLNKEIIPFKMHIFNIKCQNAAYCSVKAELKNNEAIVHIDFSENYSCKLAQEVQSFHFGSSRRQATLHTGILQLPNKQTPLTFCSISPSLEHGPAAIWAHLQPVFDLIHQEAPEVDTIHFFSDGPSSQYRQKKNFYFFTTRLFDNGFKSGTWNFFESSHGKGAADGVGAAIKRSADSFVAHRTDVPDAKTMYELVKKDTSITMFYIPEEEVHRVFGIIPQDLKSIPGTHMIHQMATHRRGHTSYKYVSCFCSNNSWLEGKMCTCHFNPKQVTIEGKKSALQIMMDEIESTSSDDDEPLGPPDTVSEKLISTGTRHLDIGNFILSEFPKNSRRTYVGKVLEYVDDGKLRVEFMKRVGAGSVFIWPETADIEYIEKSWIVRKLSNPIPGRRETFKFECSFENTTK